MTGKETLNELCKDCERHLNLSQKRCPFRSISNDYCDEYNDLLKKLDILDVLKTHLHLAVVNSVHYGNEDIVLMIDSEDKDDYWKVREWLEYETHN